jgi:hypothetical protein
MGLQAQMKAPALGETGAIGAELKSDWYKQSLSNLPAKAG